MASLTTSKSPRRRCKVGVVWQADASATACSGCGGRFSLTFRKHHCRNCGKIFCGYCSNEKAIIYDISGIIPQRVCKWCKVSLVSSGFHYVDVSKIASKEPSDKQSLKNQSSNPILDAEGTGIAKNRMDRTKSRGSNYDRNRQIELLLGHEGNNVCVECSAEKPLWVSLNNGVFVCINCAGYHRGFGVQLSKMRSLELDSLSESDYYILQISGNKRFMDFMDKYKDFQDSSLTVPHGLSEEQSRKISMRTKYESPLAFAYREVLNRQKMDETRVSTDQEIEELICKYMKIAAEQKPAKTKELKSLKSMEEKIAARPWAEDGPICNHCGSEFSAVNRRHHCRKCGALVCVICAPNDNQRPVPEFGYMESVRVCLKCFNPGHKVT